MIKTFLLALLLTISGCATNLPIDYSKMTPEAITALVKDKSVSGSCTVANTVYGRVITTAVIVDKSTIRNGTVSIDNECKVTILDTAKPATP